MNATITVHEAETAFLNAAAISRAYAEACTALMIVTHSGDAEIDAIAETLERKLVEAIAVKKAAAEAVRAARLAAPPESELRVLDGNR